MEEEKNPPESPLERFARLSEEDNVFGKKDNLFTLSNNYTLSESTPKENLLQEDQIGPVYKNGQGLLSRLSKKTIALGLGGLVAFGAIGYGINQKYGENMYDNIGEDNPINSSLVKADKVLQTAEDFLGIENKPKPVYVKTDKKVDEIKIDLDLRDSIKLREGDIVDLRTAFSRTWKNEDGSYTTEIGYRNDNSFDENGIYDNSISILPPVISSLKTGELIFDNNLGNGKFFSLIPNVAFFKFNLENILNYEYQIKDVEFSIVFGGNHDDYLEFMRLPQDIFEDFYVSDGKTYSDLGNNTKLIVYSLNNPDSVYTSKISTIKMIDENNYFVSLGEKAIEDILSSNSCFSLAMRDSSAEKGMRIFYSSEANDNLSPKLRVTYTLPEGMTEHPGYQSKIQSTEEENNEYQIEDDKQE